MKKQIVIIHGGDAYNSYEEYLSSLKKDPVEKIYFKKDHEKRWKDDLEEKLAGSFEIFQPEMPSWNNAKYKEWKVWFERMLKFVNPGAIFVGHSLGGIFLVKYLAEHGDIKKMKAAFLVAPPYNAKESKDHIADFVLPDDISKVRALGPKINLYQSEDDPVVIFSSFKKYRKALPEAKFRIFKTAGHFRVKKLPELIKDIKAL